uniref:Uncharacterized protein n=1 Tax=Arundo donax TaxID=35708 RepID=A0A0A9FH62_ARUDO
MDQARERGIRLVCCKMIGVSTEVNEIESQLGICP